MHILSKVGAAASLWRWTPTEQRAFDLVKQTVHDWRELRRKSIDYTTGAPKINLAADSCLSGGGATLLQGDDLATAEVIAFWSGKFNSAQQNYPVHEQELLAIVESLKRFRHLLQGVPFRVYTDHKGLEWITTQKKLSPRQARWLEVLSDFDFEIIHIPGITNTLRDALSRLYSDEPRGTVRAASEYMTVEEENAPSELLLSMVSSPLYTGEPIFLGASMTRARKAFPNAKKVILRVKQPSEPLEGESSTHQNLLDAESAPLVIEHSIVVDEDSHLSELPALESISKGQPFEHEPVTLPEGPGDAAASEILTESPITLPEVVDSGEPSLDIHNRIVGRYSEDPLFKVVIEQPSAYKNFELSNGLLFLKEKEKRILCIPDIRIGGRRLREILISHAHSILAHLGPRKTIIYLRDNVWWKGMNTDVQAFCESCRVCKTSKPANHAPFGLLNTLEVPTRPWQTIGVDFVGPLPESSNLNGSFDMIMLVICHLTSLVHLVPTKQTYRAKDIAEVMFDRVYKHHGMRYPVYEYFLEKAT
jgi:hypothetical protein